MIKLLVGQFVLIAIVWLAMFFFISDMNEGSKMIFYLVTSWLLFLIVILVKTFMKSRLGKKNIS